MCAKRESLVVICLRLPQYLASIWAVVWETAETLWSVFEPHRQKNKSFSIQTYYDLRKGYCPTAGQEPRGRNDFGVVPITLLANDARLSVASPKSPILTDPVGPVMKMLSHLRSLWMIGGARVWRKWSPLRICLHQLRRTLIFITLNRFRYLQENRLSLSHILKETNTARNVIFSVHFLIRAQNEHNCS